MLTTTIAQGKLDELARSHLLAKNQFNMEFSRLLREDVKPCADETGWRIVALFRDEIERYLFKLGRRERGIEQAAEEIFRLELVGQSDFSFDELLSFVKWYRVLQGNIERAIGHLFEFHGDGFADLVDGFPLAGRELVERALASHPESDRPRREGFCDEQEIASSILEKLGDKWHKLIWGGENYVFLALETACRNGYLHRIAELQSQSA